MECKSRVSEVCLPVRGMEGLATKKIDSDYEVPIVSSKARYPVAFKQGKRGKVAHFLTLNETEKNIV